ncbi:MAG: hypothetical protein RLZZ293_1367 [Pseudomonadota bacterium]|jgi:hypothetical protein
MSTGFINLLPDGNIPELFNPTTFVSTSSVVSQIEATNIVVTSTSQTNGIVDFGTVEATNLTIENIGRFTGPIIPNSDCIATTAYIDTAVTNLIDGASESLNTLNELSQALNNDSNFATNVINQLATKANDIAVVHNSGDEIIQGNKTFSNSTTLNNITFSGLINEIEPITFSHLSDVSAPIQGQLDDLNTAVTNLSTIKADLNYVDTQDQSLSNAMYMMNNNLINNINTVNTNLTNSINDNVAILDGTITSNVNTLNTTISSLQTNLQTQINTKAEKAYVDNIKTVTDTELLNLSTNKANLSYVNTQDQILQSNIDTLQTNTESQLSNLSTIKANTLYVDSADQLLQTNLNTINSNIQGQILALQSTDASLEDQIADLSNIKANITYVDTKISELVGSSPELMNTLAEVSNALNNDPNFNTTLLNQLSLKSDKTYVDGADNILQSQINTINSTKANITYVDDTKSELLTNIGTLNTSLGNQISTLSSYVDAQDLTLQTQITNLSNNKANVTYVDSTKADLQTNINSVNSSLQNQITSLSNNKADISFVNSTKSELQNDIALLNTSLQTAIGNRADFAYVDQSISNLVGLAPENLNTLQELSQAIENDANFSVSMINQLSTKANKSYVDTEIDSLQSQINDRALITNVTNSLNEKVNVLEYTSAINSINSSLDTKALNTDLINGLNTKVNQSDYTTAINSINSSLDTKAFNTDLIDGLNTKVNVSDYTTAINSINSSLDTKASSTDLINGLNTKVNVSDYNTAISDINTSLLTKASSTEVTTAVTNMKNEILGGVGPAYDTLNELSTGLQANSDLATTLTNSLATKANITYVDSSIATAISNIPPTDLTNYATTSYVDTAVANVSVDLTGYATETFVNNQISAIPPTDLTNYTTKSYVDTAVANVSVDLTGYATETFVNNQISAIPATDLTNYATKTYVDTAVANSGGNVDLTGYATETFVNTAISNIPPTDLTNYATQTFVNTATTNIKNEILGGVGPAYDTLTELKTYIETSDNSVSTALATQIATKANDNAVVHLTGTETIGGIKTFSNNVTVPSLNNISSTALGYLDATSSIQTQLNAKANSNAVVDLTNAQTIAGVKTFSSNVVVPSLNGITNTVIGYLSGTTSSIQTQLNTKANSNAVVDLTNAQTIAGVKTFSNNVVVPSLNNISSTTIGYLTNVTSDIQTQLNSKVTSSGGTFLDTTSAQTITSTATKEWQNLNIFSRIREPMITLNNVGDISDWDITLGHVGFLTPSSTNPMRIYMLNVPVVAGTTYTVTAIINTSTIKQYVNIMRVNGVGYTLRFNGGSANISIGSALYVIQTFTIVFLPGATAPSTILSSVSPWF